MATLKRPRWKDLVWWTIGQSAARLSYAAKSLEIAGHVSSYATWLRLRGLDAKGFTTRKRLLDSEAWPKLREGPVTVFEFGVASGDGTRTWLEALPNTELRWHGYDTFTGLPTDWTRGGVPFERAGAFDQGGSPPEIDDPRVTWHVGRVESTLPDFSESLRPGRIFAIFDLDLYEPSKVVLEWLMPRLEPGDLLFFDEAYDPAHERRLVDEWLDQGAKVNSLGWTGLSLLLEFVGHADQATSGRQERAKSGKDAV
jgi:hypothetical protein